MISLNIIRLISLKQKYLRCFFAPRYRKNEETRDYEYFDGLTKSQKSQNAQKSRRSARSQSLGNLRNQDASLRKKNPLLSGETSPFEDWRTYSPSTIRGPHTGSLCIFNTIAPRYKKNEETRDYEYFDGLTRFASRERLGDKFRGDHLPASSQGWAKLHDRVG
jgi:hypothetical protein